MTLQSNLFIKVFIAFWLATVAILGSWLLATDYFESQPPRPESNYYRSPGQPHRLMLRMIYNLENQSDAALVKAVANVRKKYDIEIYLVTSNGSDLLGRSVPRGVTRIVKRLLRENEKRLLGDVSHELRSPLARLRVSLALAEEKPDKRQEYMQRIEQETVRLEELINQLLSSQPQEIQLDAQIDLVPLLAQLCMDANFEGQREGKQFTFNADNPQAMVDSSSDLLRKVFENIVRNALYHTAENSRVHVSLVSNDGSYLISIEDQGPGVPEHDLENIFNEFYPVDTAAPGNPVVSDWGWLSPGAHCGNTAARSLHTTRAQA